MTSTSPVFTVRSLSVRYGGVHALTDVDLEVRPGELVGLIGPNGAGKTTLIDAVTGFAACSGSVVLDGRELSGQAPYRRARAGLARTFQAAELFNDLSVAENVGVPRRRSVRQVMKELVSGRRTPEPVVEAALARMGLESKADDLPEALSHAQRNLVGVARALAAEPRLLLLDEPAAGLDTTESAELGSRLRALADEGQAILMIDHDMSLVLTVCDRIVVLDFGRVIARGTPSEIELDPKVRSAYLGTGEKDGEGNQDFASLDESLQAAVDAAVVEESDVTTAESDEPGDPLLVLDGLAAGYGGGTVVHGVDLEVRAGEVVALLGPNGAGKTTTLRAVSRLIEPTAGSIAFDGEVLEGTAAHQLARQGLVQVPENRGIFFGLTVAEHFKGAPGGSLDFGKAADYFPELGVLEHRRAGLLSGGEQQMLALALALAREPKVLLLDELSMGLAPVVVQRMLPVVRSYAKEQRAGVLLVEQHVPLALGIADRAYVLAHGTIVLSGDARDLRRDVHALMASYLGEPPAARSGALETDRGEAGRHSAIS